MNYWILPLLMGVASMVSSCGNTRKGDDSSSALKNVFGTDQRIEGDVSSGPYRAVGRIDSGCTAFMVAPNLAATAAHCVVESSTGKVKADVGNFNAVYVGEKGRFKARVKNAWVGSFNPESIRIKDWAILELDASLGAELGVLSFVHADFSASTLPRKTSVAGYQMDFEKAQKVAVAPDCEIKSMDDKGRLLHDCDTSSGVSGGPLFESTYGSGDVVAIAVSEFRSGATDTVRRDQYSDDYANVAIPAKPASEALTQIIQMIAAGDERRDIDSAFRIEIPLSTEARRRFQFSINLWTNANFSGGVFTDDSGQIQCSDIGTSCSGYYDKDSFAVLTAPFNIISNGKSLRFWEWVCKDAKNISRGSDVCNKNGLTCKVRVKTNLVCSAKYLL